MDLFSKIRGRVEVTFRRYVLREPFLLEVARWFKDRGDDTLRLNYPLTPESVIFDLGGYHGDFAAAIHDKYGSIVYIFEPVPEFYQICVNRFKGNNKIFCLNYGLSSVGGWLDIGLAENSSSFSSPHAKGATQKVQIRSIVECIRKLKIEQIDLMKINIEGGEFDVVPAIIASGNINKIKYLQIQFHNFVEDAIFQRAEIRKQLESTHTEMWNYEFVWESWKLKGLAIE
jgi:FkbM family methyltransferase